MAALRDPSAGAQERVACYCCGESIEASNIVRFDVHPRDGLCVGCTAWLHKRGLAIGQDIRRPFFRLTRKRFTPG